MEIEKKETILECGCKVTERGTSYSYSMSWSPCHEHSEYRIASNGN